MSKARLFIPVFVFLIVSAFALTACGSSESDEDKITSLIETAATTNDPAECVETQTQNYMEQSSGKEGKEAVEKCEEDNEDETNDTESVDVEEVEVEGEEATATAAFAGGTADGQTLVFNLVEEDGDWKVNEVLEFAKFNRENLISGLEKSIGEQESIEPEVGECIVEGLEESSDSELEGLVLEGPERVEEIAEECVE